MADPTKPTAPSMFISYSWEDEPHKDWVLALATRLRADGIDVTLDRWGLKLGQDRTLFMEHAITESQYVLLICTPDYAQKAGKRERGVGWESLIITGSLAQVIDQHKFIPVLRKGDWEYALPVWLQTRLGIDFRGDPYSEDAYQDLVRELHGQALTAPPLGKRPNFSGSRTPIPESDSRTRLRSTGNNVQLEPARFRADNEPLGIEWHNLPHETRQRDIFLAPGAALWLRVLPTGPPARTWSTVQLKQVGLQDGSWLLPFFGSNFWSLRADDGMGQYSTFHPESDHAFSVAFAFESGEVWSIDTSLLSGEDIYYVEIAKELVSKLPSYAQFLERLGIPGPYRWIAGIEGVAQKKLVINATGGLALGPACLTNRIVVDGSFTRGQDANAALYPFFSRIFEKCGLHPPAIPQIGQSAHIKGQPKANAIAYAFYEKPGSPDRVQMYVRPSGQGNARFILEIPQGEQLEGSQPEIAAAFIAKDIGFRAEGFKRMQAMNATGNMLFTLPA